MSNNKQTAVEWLKDQLEHFGNKHELTVSWTTVDELIEQAKAMHKQEMIEFAQEVFRHRYNQVHQSLSNISDDIYKETFGGKDEQQYYNETYNK